VRRHAVSSRLIWLLGVILAVILVVVCITLYADTPNDTAQMITIFVVVSAVCIILFVAVSLSCLHSSKKRALTHLASQCQDTADQQVETLFLQFNTTFLGLRRQNKIASILLNW